MKIKDPNLIKQTSDIASNTKFGADMFQHGYTLGYNYSVINRLSMDIRILESDFNILSSYLQARQRYNLPIAQADIDLLIQIRDMINQKTEAANRAQSEIFATKNKMIVEVGSKIIEALLKPR